MQEHLHLKGMRKKGQRKERTEKRAALILGAFPPLHLHRLHLAEAVLWSQSILHPVLGVCLRRRLVSSAVTELLGFRSGSALSLSKADISNCLFPEKGALEWINNMLRTLLLAPYIHFLLISCCQTAELLGSPASLLAGKCAL